MTFFYSTSEQVLTTEDKKSILSQVNLKKKSKNTSKILSKSKIYPKFFEKKNIFEIYIFLYFGIIY